MSTKSTKKRPKSWARRLFRSGLIATSLLLLFLLLTNMVIYWYSHKYLYDNSDRIIHNKVGLVLGTSRRVSSGHDNYYFTYRINAAVKLFEEGKIDYLLVSGDNGTKEYNEPRDMYDALVAAGIPSDRIVLDFAGFRTLDSIVRCKEVFGQESFTIISQEFHNERAVFLAHAKGINAVGYNAQDVSRGYSIKTRIREVFARTKVFIDLFVEKQPKFLGDKIAIGE